MSTRADILDFLRNPQGFARTATDPALWTEGLDRFALPSIVAQQVLPLRFAQEEAWRGLAENRVGLVLGPPGTGKTHLLSWLVAGYGAVRAQAGRPARTFVTAFTRNAVGNVLDAIAKRQAVHDLQAPPPIFYGSPPSGGMCAGVQLLDRGDEDQVVAAIGTGRVVIGATIWSLHRLIVSGRLPIVDGPTAPIFDLICIDEASQMVMGQGLMALAGMAPDCRIVVSGDDQQLAPVRSMRSIEVDGREMGGSLYAFLKSANVAEFALEETFRLNAPLAQFPERNFYPGRYVSAVPNERLSLLDGWREGLDMVSRVALDPALPIVILVHDGSASSTSNPFEAALVAKLTEELAERVNGPNGSPSAATFWSEIAAVISPHRAQNAAIRAMLPSTLKTDAFVETVDRIQGKERDAVILSYSVADPEFALAEADFIFAPERLNVASTRARTKLVLIISRRLLDAVPVEQETMDKAQLLREFVFSCDHIVDTVVDDPSGRQVKLQIRAQSFGGDKPVLDLSPDAPVEVPLPQMTPFLEGVLAAIRRAAASNKYGAASLREVRQMMALSADPFAEARALHLLGWVSLQQRQGKFGPFWLAKPFESARRVYPVSIDTVRARIGTVIRDARSGKHCFYNEARDRFMWPSERGDDSLLPVMQQLHAEGLLRLGTAGGAATVAMAETERPAEKPEVDNTPLPTLEDADYRLLNRLEDIEAARINFGVFDSWTSTTALARQFRQPADTMISALSRLQANGHVMLADDGRVRSRIAELARELRHVKQRFKTDDAGTRPYLVRNIKVEIRDRNKPVRDQAIRSVFDKAIAVATPTQVDALEGLHQALAFLWGEKASLAMFQSEGLLKGLSAWRGTGNPTIAIAADTGSGKTEAAILPLIAGALGDRLRGINGTRAVLAYPRIRLAANQAQRLAGYLAACATVKHLPLLTLGLQISDIPDTFENMHTRYRDTWREAGRGTFEFPLFGCPKCGEPLQLIAAGGSDGADALVCRSGDWRFGGWIGSKAQIRERPPALFLPTMDSLHQWLHDPRYGALFGDNPHLAPPRAFLADEIHLYSHIHGAQVGMTLRRLAARSEIAAADKLKMVAIGMSATISDPAVAWGRLIARSDVSVVRPAADELQENPRGREYFLFVQPEIESRGADIAGASTTIQSLMCLAHGMRRRAGQDGGYRGLVFFDSIDKMRRLHGAFTDAEEGKELASLRISSYGDDASGHPQAQCCKDPIGCDRFSDGECWWFAANDPHQRGVRGRLAPGSPLRVSRSPIYSGTSSDAEVLVKGSDIVFATSALEVGYDDPHITLVYQHYAPQNLASFVQRKGRGGRGIDDRPTTAVTLSVYSSRDSWWFRRPAEMISPSGFRIPLNPDNYFVRRGQLLCILLDGIAREVVRTEGADGTRPTQEMLARAGMLAEAAFGPDVWTEFDVRGPADFWATAMDAQTAFSAQYMGDFRQRLNWAPNLLFDTINLPALKVEGSEVFGGVSEDIGLALATLAPGNATRRYNPSVVHWRRPVEGRAPWLAGSDYAKAERTPLRTEPSAVLAELPKDVRPRLVGVLPELCRPVVVTLERVGWMAGAYWNAELGFATDRRAIVDLPNDRSTPLRHDSHASLDGFVLVYADASGARSIAPITRFPGIASVDAHLCGAMNAAGSGLKIARVFWGATAELRFDLRGADAVTVSQTFVDPVSARPLLHGYEVETEGLRFALDDARLDRCVSAVLAEFDADASRRLWHKSQFLRYLIESRCQVLSSGVHDIRLGTTLLAAAVGHKAFESEVQRLARFWSSGNLGILFENVRARLLAQHPLMTPARVARAAATLGGNDTFRQILNDALKACREPAQFCSYLKSTIVHGLLLRLKQLVCLVGQGDDRKLLGHARLPIQFETDAVPVVTICEAGANGDGTIRGVIDNWSSVLDFAAAGFLGVCPNAEEDAMVQRFWRMKERHSVWRGIDPRDIAATATIAREIDPNGARDRLPPTIGRILFDQADVNAESFALYEIAADIEGVRQRALGGAGRPVDGWELASVAVADAISGVAPVLKRLRDAYGALDPDAEESLSPDARVAEQVFRLSTSLCVDGCRSCVHQASDLVAESLTEASVSRSLLQCFLSGANEV